MPESPERKEEQTICVFTPSVIFLHKDKSCHHRQVNIILPLPSCPQKVLKKPVATGKGESKVMTAAISLRPEKLSRSKE